jgi:citrate synthase
MSSPGGDQWLSAAQAAERLGIQARTLYAYVSRGLLTSHPVPGGGRSSRYPRAEVERLAARSRGGTTRAGALEVIIDSGLTLLDPAGRLFYRGWDVADAARAASYERVAEWLWTGIETGEPPTWRAQEPALEAARAVTAGLPPGAGLVDRMRVTAAAVGITDPLRHDRRPEAVAMAGRSLISALVDSLPWAGPHLEGEPLAVLQPPEGARRPESIAARLWAKLCPRRPRRGELAALNTALVVLADHELAASTLGARVAASTWADPYLVVQAGLGVLGGPLHGAAADQVRDFLTDVVGHRGAAAAIGDRLRSGASVPGLGHSVYRGPDPRAAAVLSAVEACQPPERAWRAVTEFRAVVEERGLPHPNVDLATGALCVCLGLEEGAAQGIFAVARCAGWLAHATEEYQHRLRFRPRAVYLGPEPRGARPGDGRDSGPSASALPK